MLDDHKNSCNKLYFSFEHRSCHINSLGNPDGARRYINQGGGQSQKFVIIQNIQFFFFTSYKNIK